MSDTPKGGAEDDGNVPETMLMGMGAAKSVDPALIGLMWIGGPARLGNTY